MFDSYDSLCFKIIDKTNCQFDLKTKEALYMNWRKPNLNAQQKLASFHYRLCSPCFLLYLFFFCCFLQFPFIYCFHYSYANNRHLINILITSSSLYNKPCNGFYNNYVINICPRQLL